MSDKSEHPYDFDVVAHLVADEMKHSWSCAEVNRYASSLVRGNPHLTVQQVRDRIVHALTGRESSDVRIFVSLNDDDHIAAQNLNRYLQGSISLPAPKRDIRIRKPPAHTLVSIASALLSASAYKRYVEPHIADIYHEYFEAISNDDEREAKKVVFWGYLRALWPLIAATARTIKSLMSVSGA